MGPPLPYFFLPQWHFTRFTSMKSMVCHLRCCIQHPYCPCTPWPPNTTPSCVDRLASPLLLPSTATPRTAPTETVYERSNLGIWDCPKRHPLFLTSCSPMKLPFGSILQSWTKAYGRGNGFSLQKKKILLQYHQKQQFDLGMSGMRWGKYEIPTGCDLEVQRNAADAWSIIEVCVQRYHWP